MSTASSMNEVIDLSRNGLAAHSRNRTFVVLESTLGRAGGGHWGMIVISLM